MLQQQKETKTEVLILILARVPWLLWALARVWMYFEGRIYWKIRCELEGKEKRENFRVLSPISCRDGVVIYFDRKKWFGVRAKELSFGHVNFVVPIRHVRYKVKFRKEVQTRCINVIFVSTCIMLKAWTWVRSPVQWVYLNYKVWKLKLGFSTI